MSLSGVSDDYPHIMFSWKSKEIIYLDTQIGLWDTFYFC